MKAQLLSQVAHKRLVLHELIPLATPLVIYIEPSGYCNLKCGFCPHGIEASALKKDFMSLELFKKLIDDLHDFPDKIKLLRICGNGEPLMNKDFVRMLDYAKENKNFERIELLTNGILLSTDLIKNLTGSLDRIICSIEGLCSEDYQHICNTNVDFNNLLKKIDTLYACKGKCTIYIKIHNQPVVSKEAKKSFYDTFTSRCDEIFIERLVPMWPQLDSAHFTHEFRWDKNEVIKRKVCVQIFKGVQVQADGEVVPCCVDWKRVNVLGNINNESLFDIWKGESLRKLQINHLSGNKGKMEPCKDCAMNDYCEYDNIDLYVGECMRRLLKQVH